MNNAAYKAALGRLNVREYSAHELAVYLRRKGFEAEEIAIAVAALLENKYLDDARYAKMMARYQAGRGKGPAYIRAKLRQKGVSISIPEIKALVAEAGGRSELETAREIVARRYPRAKEDKATALKAMQGLIRRGFSYDLARQAVSNSLPDEIEY